MTFRTAWVVLLQVTSTMSATALSAQERDPLACKRPGHPLRPIGVYSFFSDAGQILCVAPRDDSDGTDVPCLRIGELYVGQGREEIEAQLGSPWRVLEFPSSSLSTAAYLVFSDSTSDRGAYYVVEYERVDGGEVAFAVQLTGDRPASFRQFSCLNLDDPVRLVEQQLGAPSDVSTFEADEIGLKGVVWSYDPLPVSIELVDGKVYSFRVWRPDHVAPKERKLSLLEKH